MDLALYPTSRTVAPGTTAVMSGFWLCLWSFVLSLGWLLPNHYPPWSSFHFDTWSATFFAVAALAVLVRTRSAVPWSPLVLLVGALAVMPMIQYGAGMMFTPGNSWISTAYLLGFLLAVLTGACWARSGEQVSDGLFLAIGIASIASVGLQLHQWLQLDRLDIWSMGQGLGRPFANFGQPNQLGTFLIWGLLAGAWAYVRGRIRGATAVLYAMFLLFGLSLTASRTAWIAMGIVVAGVWGWRHVWPQPRMVQAVTGLAAYFVLCVVSGNWLSRFVTGQVLFDAGSVARISGESRPAIWAMFVEAILQRPWWGYGWNQTGPAQVLVADGLPALHVNFSHAHNLVLDLMLWCGVPIGLLVALFLAWWLLCRVRQTRTPEQALLVLLLLVVANHAMLELPLHYAYLLLPTGLVMGVLEQRHGVRPWLHSRRWVMLVLWATSVVLLTLLVRDYWRVERSYEALRYEWSRLKTAPAVTPDVLLLTQWPDYFRLLRLEPTPGMSAQDLQSYEHAASMYPISGLVQRLAVALAFNGRPDDAALWLRRVCKIVSREQCAALQASWVARARVDARLAAVRWPS
jgi:O-antigen ligase